MLENYIWFIWSLGLIVVWSVIFISYKKARRRMLWASLLTMPFGLTEPLFVPEYWNPPSLFNLASTTGFDLESLIFCFGIGGLGIVLYDIIFKVEHEKMEWSERHDRHHRFHLYALISPVVFFLVFYFVLGWNAIYSGSFAMFLAGLAALWCRPDLKLKIWIGGVIFLVFYFVYFFLLDILNPGYVERVWNMSAISGIVFLGIPIEELLFAFTFGMLWSSYYEHINWYKLKPKSTSPSTN